MLRPTPANNRAPLVGPGRADAHHRTSHLTAEFAALTRLSRFELRSPSKYLRRPGAEANPFADVSFRNSSNHEKVVGYTAVQDNPGSVVALAETRRVIGRILPFDKKVIDFAASRKACPNQLMTRVSCSATGSSGGVSIGLCSHLVNSR